MKQHSFTMKLKAGYEKEYKKRHDEIWPELKQLLSESGIQKYVIYLDEDTGTLFAYQELNDDFENISINPVVQKWWRYMKDIMDTNPDNSPVTKPLKKVFQMK